PRRRADAAGELETGHAGAAADVALGHPAAFGGIERLEDVLLLDVEAERVVEVAVVGFGDDRQRPVLLALDVLGQPLDGAVADGADAGGVGQHDRAFEEAGLLDPGGAGHLAVAVEREPAGEDRVAAILFAARQYSRDAGPHRPFTDLQLA